MGKYMTPGRCLAAIFQFKMAATRGRFPCFTRPEKISLKNCTTMPNFVAYHQFSRCCLLFMLTFQGFSNIPFHGCFIPYFKFYHSLASCKPIKCFDLGEGVNKNIFVVKWSMLRNGCFRITSGVTQRFFQLPFHLNSITSLRKTILSWIT